MANGVENFSWQDPQFNHGFWESAPTHLAEPATRLVPSWQVESPADNDLYGPYIETYVQARTVNGEWGSWRSVGRYAFASVVDADGVMKSLRATQESRDDDHSNIRQDTVVAANEDLPFDAFKLGCDIVRDEHAATITVRGLAVAASNHLQLQKQSVYPSKLWSRVAVELDVPQISQYALGDKVYPQLDGGSARAWCSPTAVTMIMRYFDAGPTAAELSDLPRQMSPSPDQKAYADVAHAAYHTFDAGLPEVLSTGNWPFNTAYASHYGLDAQVAAYPDLNDIEERLHRGLPTAVSLRWDNTSPFLSEHLEGVAKDKVSGHLVVVRGVTKDGDIIINDPATPEGDDEVRRIVDRGQFERCWLNHGGWGYQIDPRAQ